jgi:predicted dehydrogenase
LHNFYYTTLENRCRVLPKRRKLPPDDVITKPVPKRWISISPPREWSYRKMIKYFIKCIVEDKEPELTSGKDGAKVIEIICGVFKSMETNSWVDLPLKEEVVPPHYKLYYEKRKKMGQVS